MRVPMQQFLEQMSTAVGEIPARAWRVAVMVVALSCAVDLILRVTVPTADTALLAGILLIVPWQAALCLGILGVLRQPVTVAAWLRFAMANLATLAPATIAISAMLWLDRHSYDLAAMAMAALCLGGIVLMALLTAWPTRQAVSNGFVSPLQAIRDTRGHRWSLFLSATIAAHIGRIELFPALADDPRTSAIVAVTLSGALLSLAAFGLQTAIAATAWRLANRTDPAGQR